MLLEELEAGEVVAVVTVDVGVQGPCVDDQGDPTTSRASNSSVGGLGDDDDMRFLRTLLVAGLVSTGTACSDDGADEAGAPVTTQTTEATDATSATAPRTGPVLQKVALVESDLPQGVQLELVEGGDEVEGRVTLDMCGYQFTTEQARAERYQIEASDDQGARVVSNEGVLYESAQDAAAAMEELRTSIRECPEDRPVRSAVEGVPPLTYDLTLVPEEEMEDLVADRVALSAVLRDEEGQSATFGLVYQRRGRVLVGLYDGSVASVLPYAKLVAQRLAALSAEQAGE